MQGDKKMGQKGTDAMFVMTHDKIKQVREPCGLLLPQKEDPHCIHITKGGNLIKYESSPLVHTADLDTAKLHCSSVVSTHGTKYMCLDAKSFYLAARLDYFESMQMQLAPFPSWIQQQYNLVELGMNGFVHL